MENENIKCYFDNGKKCNVLTTKVCLECSFRKSEAEFKCGRSNAEKKLKKLPKDKLKSIAAKYHTALYNTIV